MQSQQTGVLFKDVKVGGTVRIRCRGIRFRIYTGTGVLVLLGLVLAAVAVAELASIGRQVATMAVSSEENARILEVERLLEIAGRSALGYWLSGDAAILQQGSEADTSAEALLKQTIESASTDQERQILRAVMSGIEAFRRSRNVLVIMTNEVGGLRHDLADGGDAVVGNGTQLADAAAATGDQALTQSAWGIEKALLQTRSDAWRFFATPDSQHRAAFKTSADKAMEAVGHFQDAELSDELQSLTVPVASGLAVYASNFEQLSEQVLKQRELFEQQLRPQVDHLLGLVRNAAETQRRNLNGLKQTTDTLIGETIFIQKSIAGLGFAIGLLIALLVCRSIIRPLAGMTASMGKLAAGNTAIDIPSRSANDEMRAMAEAVEVFRQNAIARAQLEAAQAEQQRLAAEERQKALTSMAETIESQSGLALEEVGRRTAAMEATAHEMTASAQRTGSAAQNAAETATHALVTAQTVASAAEQLAASVREIGGQASQSTEVVNRAINAGHTARQTIEALNERVARIGAVTEMIREIASRTNLLALNATIEAARAGEAGKGFAVVATEVKQLATQTAHSTAEISQHIGEVRNATDASVAAVEQIEQTIAEINAIASSVAAAVEQQGATTAEIARTIAESATAANDIARQASEVSGEAEQTNRQATELRSDASGLDVAVRELKRSVIKVVRTATSEVDRRHHPRHEVDWACRIGPHTARLTDLSEEGACVREGPSLPTGAEGTLQIAELGAQLRYTVRCATEDALHLAFDVDQAAATELRAFLEALPRREAA